MFLAAKGVMAQGVVSLSEEAMFDDELETNQDFPAASSATAQQPYAPASNEQIPDANEPSDEEKTEQAGQLSVADDSTTQPDELPILAVTSQKNDAPVTKPSKSLDSINSTSATKVDDLFSQMSDIERNTALLNLELRREKLQNEIEEKKNQMPVAMLNVKQSKENYELSFGRYKVGEANPTELKDAQLAYLDAQLQYYQAMYEYNSAKASLERAVGKNLTQYDTVDLEEG